MLELADLTDQQIKDFWATANPKNWGPDDCWIWSGRRNCVNNPIAVFNGKTYYAQNVAFYLAQGFVMAKPVLHRCKFIQCCNPNHLSVHVD